MRHAEHARHLPRACRFDAAAHRRAAAVDGAVGRRTGASAGAEPAARIAPRQDPVRRRDRRAPQGRQLGVRRDGRGAMSRRRCAPRSMRGKATARMHWAEADAARLAAVRADRAAHAAGWFEGNAGRMGRDPLAPCRRGARSRRRWRAVLGDARVERLIDIGTGTGRMLELFAGAGRPCARHRSQLRNAAAGARQARATRASSMPNCARPISTRCRSTAAPRTSRSCTMCSISRRQPGAAIAEAARVLGAGRAAADRRFRAARARGIADARRACAAGLFGRADARLVRGRGAGAGADRDARGRRADGEIVAGAQERRAGA